MTRIILLDADGVVIAGRHKYFSNKYSEDYGVPVEEIMPFFKGEYKKAALGEVDIREILPNYLEKWGWKGTVDEFLKYWFEGEREVDQRVLDVVQQLRNQGAKVYLASDNEKNRAQYIMDEVGLGNLFDGGFFSSHLGVTKSEPTFFEKIAEELGVPVTELECWDDDPKNVEVAKGIGVQAFVYDNFDTFKKSVEK